MITAELLRAAGVKGDADAWAAALAPAADRHAINTPRRIAGFLARTMQETISYTVLVESLNYSAERLVEVWPSHFDAATAERLGRTAGHLADQQAIANLAYGGRLGNTAPGDGWLYRGRGLIQLTGKANYLAFATKIGVRLADLPALLQTPDGAAESAAHYWATAGCNEAADRGDVAGFVRLVNGGTNGLADTQALYDHILPLILVEPPPAPALPPAPSRPGLFAMLAVFLASLAPRRA